MANKLMVVAHPDDESIFGGSKLIKERGWKVVCVTNASNQRRYREFARAMRYVDAEFEIWDFEDVWGGDFPRDELKRELQRVLAKEDYSMIVTHNLHGEYGHTQHKALSEVMHQLVKQNLWVFGIKKIPISKNLHRRKRQLLKFYRSQHLAIRMLMKYVRYEQLFRVR